jgi:hypothetical protein
MRFDQIVVMGYRNTAGSSCSGSQPDGIICLDEPAIAYAGEQHQNDVILAGLETSNCSPGCGPFDVTFYSDPQGQTSVNQQVQLVAEHFKESQGFGGFAIHRYQDSYLSGLLTNWPAVNLNFPVDR